MKKLEERGKRGPVSLLLRIPLFLLFLIVNIVILSWLGYVLYCLFTDAQVEKSLIEWAGYLFVIFKRFL